MSKQGNLKPDIDLKKYQDQTGVSLWKMNFGLWLSENRRHILKLIIAVLVAICAFFFIYSSYNFISYYISGDPNATTVADGTPTSPRQVTADLGISPLQIFPGLDRSDLAVKLQNPNDKFSADFKYCFTLSDRDLTCGRSFILPGEEKYILALGQELVGSESAVAFKVSDIFWRRLDAHQIPDWNSFFTNRLTFPVTAVNFSSGGANNLSAKVDFNNLAFTISNQTPYSYYQVPLNILIFSGSELVGVNRYSLDNFLTGESRTIKMSWPGSLAAVDRTEVKPDVNILDETVYLKYRGGSGN